MTSNGAGVTIGLVTSTLCVIPVVFLIDEIVYVPDRVLVFGLITLGVILLLVSGLVVACLERGGPSKSKPK